MFTIMDYIRGMIFFLCCVKVEGRLSKWSRVAREITCFLDSPQNSLFTVITKQTDSFQPPQVANAGLADFTSRHAP